ncbi:hypothetical protein GCM10010347_63950 [Streptomyces cirratus]|uniref:Uncharacterized protein n=1 Tax=Streptomyces cirratus TaxID=68187 RepID=A0ABQ3F2M5_9ACTN|nr:hypothetical protein GCM10010347_63950 [Streptomyces cirratus]
MAEATAPIVESAEEALVGLSASENDRYEALVLTLAAKWHCVAVPVADRFTTWEAWIIAMQTGSALFAAGRPPKAPSPAGSGSTGMNGNCRPTGHRSTCTPGTGSLPSIWPRYAARTTA